LGTPQGGGTDFETTFAPDGDGYLLNGTKFYSTGNLYADWLFVTGRFPDGAPASALLPVTREGIDLVDDWDGIGQRLTGSGTTKFVNVRVAKDELVASGGDVRVGTGYRAVFAQLYLSAVIAGVMSNIHDDAVKLVRARSRNFYHGIADKPRNEPGVQEIVGQISTNAWLARTIVREAALALEHSQDRERLHGDSVETRMQASIVASRVKVIVDDLGPATASLLFEVGGGQTVRAGLQFDRHWRNIKTLSAHNPRIYKLRVLGDYELNGTPLPVGPFF
jgi:alkylation response protein AidB-like acyl-CoA dehydrogenase